MSRRDGLFARFSLDYADHPKIAGLSDSAFRTHVEMILYSRRYLTDGQIAKQIAKRWPSEALSELQANHPDAPSLIALDGGGYEIHGFSDMQETRAEVEKRRQIRAESGRKGGLARAKHGAKHGAKQNPSRDRDRDRDRTKDNSISSEVAVATPDPPRPEIEEILDYLDEKIVANGCKKPGRNKRNRDAVRLMLDLDGRKPDQIRAAIDFATGDEFWRSNILSASKLREKYDTLAMQAQRSNWKRPGNRHEQRRQFWEGELAQAKSLDDTKPQQPPRALEAS